MSGTYSNWKTLTVTYADDLRDTCYISLKWLLDSDTKAKNIATEIANFMSKLDTPAKAEFDRKVKNAFQVKNPKPTGLQLYQKELMCCLYPIQIPIFYI